MKGYLVKCQTAKIRIWRNDLQDPGWFQILL